MLSRAAAILFKRSVTWWRMNVCIRSKSACPILLLNALLLWQVLMEGICDFVGEKVAGQQINSAAHEYGDKHEKELWDELKTNLCGGDISRWLYNGQRSTDRPGDLGYYMGYRIAKRLL